MVDMSKLRESLEDALREAKKTMLGPHIECLKTGDFTEIVFGWSYFNGRRNVEVKCGKCGVLYTRPQKSTDTSPKPLYVV